MKSRASSSTVSRFVEQLENRQLMSLVVDVRLPGGAKTANVNTVGQVVNLEVWGTAKGGNSTGTDEGLQHVVGSLLSTNVSGGAANGTLKVTPAGPFNAIGSGTGAQRDLDADGDLDVGSNTNSSATGFFVARSATLTKSGGVVSGAQRSFLIATATFTVTSLKSTTGSTNLAFRDRNWVSGALWQEDNGGALKNNTTGSYTAGSPVVIKRGTGGGGGGGGGTTRTISGKVWNDTDGDGVLDTGETGRAGATVYIDTDKDGIKDAGEPSKTADGSGNYSFTGLASGSYRLRVSGASGYRVSAPSTGYHDVNVTTANASGKNFGFSQRTLITGRLWVDSDNDNVKDSAESVLSGWKVFIDKDKDGTLDAGESVATTDSSGNYSFKSLVAGSYRVRVVQQTGYTRLAPTSGYYDFTLGNGGTKTGQNFRFRR